MHILIIEDEIDLAESLADYLEARGCEVVCAPDGRSGLRLASDGRFDVLVVDVGLPRLSGIEMVQLLRQNNCHVPVLFLTARGDANDVLDGFNAGADDYQVKPCPLPELHARLRAIVARCSATLSLPHVDRLEHRGLMIDRAQYRAWFHEQEIELTPTCFTLLWLLAESAPKVVTRQKMIHVLWGDDPPPTAGDPLRSHLYNLRTALIKVGAETLLHTQRGVGVRLE